jgi:hypothetical protein
MAEEFQFELAPIELLHRIAGLDQTVSPAIPDDDRTGAIIIGGMALKIGVFNGMVSTTASRFSSARIDGPLGSSKTRRSGANRSADGERRLDHKTQRRATETKLGRALRVAFPVESRLEEFHF